MGYRAESVALELHALQEHYSVEVDRASARLSERKNVNIDINARTGADETQGTLFVAPAV